jgi:hypothetical protein
LPPGRFLSRLAYSKDNNDATAVSSLIGQGRIAERPAKQLVAVLLVQAGPPGLGLTKHHPSRYTIIMDLRLESFMNIDIRRSNAGVFAHSAVNQKPSTPPPPPSFALKNS